MTKNYFQIMGKIIKSKRYYGRKENVEQNCYFENYLKSVSKSIFQTFKLYTAFNDMFRNQKCLGLSSYRVCVQIKSLSPVWFEEEGAFISIISIKNIL